MNNNNNENENNKKRRIQIENENENDNNNNNNNNNNVTKEEMGILNNIINTLTDFPNCKSISIDGNNAFPEGNKKLLFMQDQLYHYDYENNSVFLNSLHFHENYTDVTLSGGKIALFGGTELDRGLNNNTMQTISESSLFNIKDNKFYCLANMHVKRNSSGGVLLRNGNVFIAGGCGSQGFLVVKIALLKSCELFNTSNKTFALCKSQMKHARIRPTVCLLPNGNPIIFGGYDGTSHLNSTEIYDINTDSFIEGPRMPSARHGHSATLLFNNEILICAGYGAEPCSTVIYDPIKNNFREGPMMIADRKHHHATRLSDGKVLLYGETKSYLNQQQKFMIPKPIHFH